MEAKGYKFDFAACKPAGISGRRRFLALKGEWSIKQLVKFHNWVHTIHLCSLHAYSQTFAVAYGGKGRWYLTYLLDVVKPPYNPNR
jgi:hypothetical protein